MLSALLASIISFLIGRYIFSSQAKEIASKYPLIEAIDRAMETDGFYLMTLLHFCPLISFSIINFVIGITSMKIMDFCLSIVGILPSTIICLLMGTSISNLNEVFNGDKNNKNNSKLELYLVVGGSIIGLLGLIYTSYIVRGYFDEIMK